MSISDYRRPADYQVQHHYTCRSCGSEVEVESFYAGPSSCHCGGLMEFSGESYPASADEWDEERDGVNDDWHNRNRW